MLLGVYYTLSNLEKVDDGDLTVTFFKTNDRAVFVVLINKKTTKAS